ncbi:hypothetical protein V2J09_011823 [Rumex salicifolius]
MPNRASQMGYSKLNLIISLACFLIISFTQITSIAQGRQMSNAAVVYEVRVEGFKERALIGSRPPKCERRCSSCVHCIAIEVPIVPQKRRLIKPIETLNSRGDNLSNYKPVSWKCKCGNLIFTP